MKILVYTTSSNNVYTVLDSLRYLGKHEVVVFHYDEKFLREVDGIKKTNPDLVPAIMAHQWPPRDDASKDKFAAWLDRVSRDQEMIAAAKILRPDLMLYISAWEGDFVPSNDTLKVLGDYGPLVHLCFDASDPPWWPQMKVFEEKKLFALTVNIDGGHVWPGGNKWHWRGFDADFDHLSLEAPVMNGLTVLTPCDPRYFQGVQVPFRERPYQVGYAGNAGGWIRSHLVGLLQRHKGHIFTWRPRDEQMNSYRNYCDFLRYCRVVISVPFSGSNAVKQVKGRVVEAGWAGAALLEWKNEATASWFQPRADYEEYRDVQECLDLAEWLANQPDRCEDMATNLQLKVTTEHSPEKIWGAIFEKVGITSSSRPGSPSTVPDAA